MFTVLQTALLLNSLKDDLAKPKYARLATRNLFQKNHFKNNHFTKNHFKTNHFTKNHHINQPRSSKIGFKGGRLGSHRLA